MMFVSAIAAAPRTAPAAAVVCSGNGGMCIIPENQGQSMITGPGGP